MWRGSRLTSKSKQERAVPRNDILFVACELNEMIGYYNEQIVGKFGDFLRRLVFQA